MAAAGVVDLIARLPRAGQRGGARDRQPQPMRDRVEQVIIFAPSDQLRAFGALGIVDHPPGGDPPQRWVQAEQRLGPVAAARGRDIGRSVIVEEQPRIERGLAQPVHRPGPADVAGAVDPSRLADRRDRDIEHSVVMPQAGGEDTAAVRPAGLQVIFRAAAERVDDMRREPPVHQIPGGQDRQPRHVGKGARDEIEDVADADDVGIGIIGVQRWVREGPVTAIGLPGLHRADRRRCDQRRR